MKKRLQSIIWKYGVLLDSTEAIGMSLCQKTEDTACQYYELQFWGVFLNDNLYYHSVPEAPTKGLEEMKI